MQTLKDQLWTMEVPVITTGHFPQVDADRLYLGAMFISQEPEDKRSAILAKVDFEEQPILEDLSESTRAILGFIFSHADYVRLDPDGDTLDNFPTFQW